MNSNPRDAGLSATAVPWPPSEGRGLTGIDASAASAGGSHRMNPGTVSLRTRLDTARTPMVAWMRSSAPMSSNNLALSFIETSRGGHPIAQQTARIPGVVKHCRYVLRQPLHCIWQHPQVTRQFRHGHASLEGTQKLELFRPEPFQAPAAALLHKCGHIQSASLVTRQTQSPSPPSLAGASALSRSDLRCLECNRFHRPALVASHRGVREWVSGDAYRLNSFAAMLP
jgi:hypothetical protein